MLSVAFLNETRAYGSRIRTGARSAVVCPRERRTCNSPDAISRYRFSQRVCTRYDSVHTHTHTQGSFDERLLLFTRSHGGRHRGERWRVRWREYSSADEVTRYLKRVILSPFAFFSLPPSLPSLLLSFFPQKSLSRLFTLSTQRLECHPPPSPPPPPPPAASRVSPADPTLFSLPTGILFIIRGYSSRPRHPGNFPPEALLRRSVWMAGWRLARYLMHEARIHRDAKPRTRPDLPTTLHSSQPWGRSFEGTH